MGSEPAVLSIVMSTAARPRAGRPGAPAKITSDIDPPRRLLAECVPSTHDSASTMLDLPDPFGPTMTVIPGSKSRWVFSAKDLKPRSVRDLRNTRRSVTTGQPASAEASQRAQKTTKRPRRAADVSERGELGAGEHNFQVRVAQRLTEGSVLFLG